MKKIVLAAALLCSTASYAEGFFFKPTVGADYQFTHYGNEDASAIVAGAQTDDFVDTSLHGFNIHAGARVHKYLGFELGYFQTEKGEVSDILGTGFSGAMEIKGANFDVLGYYPVAPKTELIGTVGVSYAQADFSGTALVADFDEEEVKMRVGGGAQYWITDNMNVRGLVRYQGADFDGIVDNAVVATAGLNWQF